MLTLAVLCVGRVLDKYGYVSVYVQCAGAYGPMSLEKGPNKGQGPLDGARWNGSLKLWICRCPALNRNRGRHRDTGHGPDFDLTLMLEQHCHSTRPAHLTRRNCLQTGHGTAAAGLGQVRTFIP